MSTQFPHPPHPQSRARAVPAEIDRMNTSPRTKRKTRNTINLPAAKRELGRMSRTQMASENISSETTSVAVCYCSAGGRREERPTSVIGSLSAAGSFWSYRILHEPLFISPVSTKMRSIPDSPIFHLANFLAGAVRAALLGAFSPRENHLSCGGDIASMSLRRIHQRMCRYLRHFDH